MNRVVCAINIFSLLDKTKRLKTRNMFFEIDGGYGIIILQDVHKGLERGMFCFTKDKGIGSMKGCYNVLHLQFNIV